VLESDDQLTLEWSGAWRRYHAPMMNTLVVGKPRPAHLRMRTACIEALQACENVLKPGNTLGNVFNEHAKILDEHGLRKHRLNACGYSVGARFTPSWMDSQMFFEGAGTDMILMDSETGTAQCLGRTSLVTQDGSESPAGDTMTALKSTKSSTALVRILALPVMVGALSACDFASKLPDAPSNIGGYGLSQKPPSVTGRGEATRLPPPPQDAFANLKAPVEDRTKQALKNTDVASLPRPQVEAPAGLELPKPFADGVKDVADFSVPPVSDTPLEEVAFAPLEFEQGAAPQALPAPQVAQSQYQVPEAPAAPAAPLDVLCLRQSKFRCRKSTRQFKRNRLLRISTLDRQLTARRPLTRLASIHQFNPLIRNMMSSRWKPTRSLERPASQRRFLTSLLQ